MAEDRCGVGDGAGTDSFLQIAAWGSLASFRSYLGILLVKMAF